jgi:TonB family protein
VFFQGLEGSVVVSLTLDRSGRVTGVQVVRGSGHSTLDQLAREASMKWRLSPESVLDTDLNVGRLELIKFRQSNGHYARSLLPGDMPYWARLR